MISRFLHKYKLSIIIISFILLVTFPFYINARIKFDEIEKNGKIGIGKFVEYEKKPKSKHYYFEYYNGNKKVNDLLTRAPKGFYMKVGGFFEIKYLDEYDDIIVDFDKEITDTTLILKAGFSKEDIANMPK